MGTMGTPHWARSHATGSTRSGCFLSILLCERLRRTAEGRAWRGAQNVDRRMQISHSPWVRYPEASAFAGPTADKCSGLDGKWHGSPDPRGSESRVGRPVPRRSGALRWGMGWFGSNARSLLLGFFTSCDSWAAPIESIRLTRIAAPPRRVQPCLHGGIWISED